MTRRVQCASDVNCMPWEYCRSQTFCEVRNKLCANNCSNQGVCFYYQVLTGTPVSTCSLFDSSCAAICRCLKDFAGTTCEMSSTLFDKIQEIRLNSLKLLSNQSLHAEPSFENLRHWQDLLAGITSTPVELPKESLNLSMYLETASAFVIDEFNHFNDSKS